MCATDAGPRIAASAGPPDDLFGLGLLGFHGNGFLDERLGRDWLQRRE